MSDILFQQIAKLISKRVLAWLAKKAAWAAWGPIGVVIGFFVEKLVVVILEQTWLGAQLMYMFIDTERQVNKLESIIKEVNEKDELTPDQIQEYDKRLTDAGRDLIEFASLASCAHVSPPNAEVCIRNIQGASCFYTIEGKETRLTEKEYRKIRIGRITMAASEYAKFKLFIKSVCKIKKNLCKRWEEPLERLDRKLDLANESND